MRSFLAAEGRRFLNTCLWSWAGWTAAWASEKTLRQWTIVNALSIAASFAIDMTPGERGLIWALGLLILAAELMNTGLEEVVDYLSTDAVRIEPGQVGRVAALGERVRLHRRVHAAHAAYDKALKGSLVGLKAAEPFARARHALVQRRDRFRDPACKELPDPRNVVRRVLLRIPPD